VPDATGVALVHVRSWQEAYRGQIDQSHLDSLDATALAERWAGGIAEDRWPRQGVLVATQITTRNNEIPAHHDETATRNDDLAAQHDETPAQNEGPGQNREIVGFVSFAPTCDDDLDPGSVVVLQAIYVLPGRWRGGVGRLLMDSAVDAFADAGYAEAALWMLDGNTRAARFYAATGWRADGARERSTIGGREYDVVRLRRTISRTGSAGTPA